MTVSKAFKKLILPSGSGADENFAVHQVSPAWVITFVRWSARDTLRTPAVPATQVENLQLVVENDCIAVSTADSKGTLTPTCNISLMETDVNYATAVAPGDFVFINMLNWEEDQRRVANQARAGRQINKENDGFKGIYKVQSVRKTLVVDEASGTKHVVYKITGFAFTEFNNSIYFNPYMLDIRSDDNALLFSSYIGRDWAKLVNAKGLTSVQDIVQVLIESFIGSGINEMGAKSKDGTVISPNVHFFMPAIVGNLLGLKGVKAAKDIFVYMFGIQQFASGEVQSLKNGMNPTGLKSVAGGFYNTPNKVQGDTLVKPEFWNQVKTWSILNQFTNAPLNELYTAFKLSPGGKVLPTVVFRQTPFTTDSYSSSTNVTRFKNLPRWKISSALIISADIGREEAARINFVQMFGRTSVTANGSDLALEIAKGNYVYDIGDVQRSGLRPYIINTQFDEPGVDKKEFSSPLWAKILGDSIIGGHLKLNGTIVCAGLVDPIAVGDNLEFDGVIYHIETVSHNCSMAGPNGRKTFRTSIGLSSGVQNTDKSDQHYGEMDYSGGYEDRERDFNNLQILPGVSESQDTIYRKKNVDLPRSGSRNFAQPGAGAVAPAKDSGDDDE